MRVAIVGGGPAGLALALFLKRLDARHEIDVFDQRDPSDTYGWGITLPRHTLRDIVAWDESLGEPLAQIAAWDTMELIHHDRHVHIRGASVAGVARLHLLQALQARCVAHGVVLHFNVRLGVADPLPAADLIVGADGARSIIRSRFADQFRPSIVSGTNRYTWLGTTRPFEQLTFGFKETPQGTFAFHAYPYSASLSTFIVECTGQTWEAEGFEFESSDGTVDRLAGMFTDVLGQHRLLFRDTVTWSRFSAVSNERCHHENIVLLGDALHAVHFSVGSGTMLAFQDAIALAESVRDHRRIEDILSSFESRHATVDYYQQIGMERAHWYEQMNEYMHLGPLELAYALLSRNPEQWRAGA